MTTYTIELPLKLESFANKRMHWAQKRKAIKNIRIMLTLMLTSKKVPNLRQAERSDLKGIRVSMTRISSRTIDFDNLVFAFKEIRDWIADWIIPGLAAGRADNDPIFEFVYSQQKGKVNETGIHIQIEFIKEQNVCF